MASRQEGFFVQDGDELDYHSAIVPSEGKKPIHVNGHELVVPRLRVRRDSAGKAITQPPGLWFWEVNDPDQLEPDGSETWMELGFFSGPKDLEKKLLDFFARDWGDKVTGPTGALKDGHGVWDRFLFRRSGEQTKKMMEVREEYWQAQRQQQQQQEEEQEQEQEQEQQQ
ncbi:uncharacterized protein A1O5_04307 [Cladophialophora psammophila CBS 110553]|uniref:Uncharacterized protein n=1 Tax=Cladophialophora psammophila CBS 110553 TaxID=1182543 RepID=W9WY52_9EURO|nr:uncharacterized protein A1O5_04307 [Cladophialophora psammophila CBS 110553]EXJ73157.1 hypothetical protein A1O5_04307 [Cladophialophora psammophila CBS 110553]